MRSPTSRLAVLALALATVFTGVSVPADAGVPNSKPVTGVPGRTSGISTPPGGGDTQCVDRAGYLKGRFIYSDPYSRCVSSNGRAGTKQHVGVAGTWFEVWRFYGTEANPTQAWTVSRLNQPEWGNETYAYAVFAPHPDDAGLSSTPTAGPWEAYETDAGNRGRVFNSSGSQRKSPGKTVVSKLRANGKPVLATDKPFRAFGSCTAVETDDAAIARYFDPSHPEYAEDNSKSFRADFYGWFTETRDQTGSVEVALATINARGSRADGPGRQPRNGDDILYDDRIPCSSSFDFVVSEAQAPKQFTTCWIPVEMRYIMVDTGVGEHRNFTVAGGPRYHTDTYPSQSGDSAYAAARQKIYDEVLSRSNGDVLTPAQPYVSYGSSNQPPRVATAAARTARDHVQCTRGYGSMQTETGPGGQEGQTPDRLEVKITSGPKRFVHVGGQFDPATWTAVSGSLLCSGKPCSGNLPPRLMSLSYTLRITGTGGYTPCAGGRTTCDFDVELGKSKTRGRITTQASATGYFYRATTGSQRVKVEIVNARGVYRTYRVVEETTGACSTSIVTVWDGSDSAGGGPQPCERKERTIVTDHPFTPTVNGNRELRVTSSVGRR